MSENEKSVWERLIEEAGKAKNKPKMYPSPLSSEIDKGRKMIVEQANRIKELESKIKELEIPPSTMLTESTTVLIVPICICPECKDQHITIVMPDMLRVKFTHGIRKDCSRSNTVIIRPLAQFTQTI